MPSIFWMSRKPPKPKSKTTNHIVMKRKTDKVESQYLPYVSPSATVVEVKAEGVLCISGENDDEYKEVDFEW